MSSQLKAALITELDTLNIDTASEVKTFRAVARNKGNMATVLANVRTTLGVNFVSRKQVRALSYQLLKRGELTAD